MSRRVLKITLRLLFREWNWKALSKRKYVDKLIWTNTRSFRRDERVVQNVGKPVVKFRFNVGSYGGCSPAETPRHFSISTTGKEDRICWMALPNDELYVRQRKGLGWEPPFRLTDFFDDPLQPGEEELDLLEFLVPGITDQLPELLPGLHGVDAALKERFTGLL